MQMPTLNGIQLILNLGIRTTFACMASGDISTTEAGDTFISLLRVHLVRSGILKQSKQGEATAMIKRRMEKLLNTLGS